MTIKTSSIEDGNEERVYSKIGLPLTGIRDLGIFFVSSPNLVPLPAANIIACIIFII